MAGFEITTAHRKVRNQASITLADTGAGAACIKLYSERGGILMAVRSLAKPCGVLTAEGYISLQTAVTNDLAVLTGTPTWGEWCDGAGVAIVGGAVTPADGPGPFRMSGAANGMVYEGGIVLLASPSIIR